MFDFEKFPVYIKTKELIKDLQPLLQNKEIHINLKDQLRRSSSSILLNIAEGAGKYSKRDKKNYYLTARGSLQESLAAITVLEIENIIDKETYSQLYLKMELISKMLSGLINKMLE